MDRSLLVEDAWPRSRESVALARRILAVRWFREMNRLEDPALRIAHAVAEHGALIALAQPLREVSVLGGADGRAAIRGGAFRERVAWGERLRHPLPRLIEALLSSDRARGHPVILPSGRCLLMQPSGLAIPQQAIWERLEGPAEDRLPEPDVRTLIDRILWEVGMMVAWEMVGDLIGPNPYTPLLTLYEDGLYPLDFDGGKAVLWAPAGVLGPAT